MGNTAQFHSLKSYVRTCTLVLYMASPFFNTTPTPLCPKDNSSILITEVSSEHTIRVYVTQRHAKHLPHRINDNFATKYEIFG
jgi:hypothetical protein